MSRIRYRPLALYGDTMTATDIQKATIPVVMALSIMLSAIGVTWYVTDYIASEFADIRILIAEELATRDELNELAARVRLTELTLAGHGD